MKTAVFALTLLLAASTAQAQNFGRQSQARVNFWYYESVPYDYGYYGYPRYVPFGRYQQYVPPQQYFPAYRGVIPGAVSNGYFLPDFYGW